MTADFSSSATASDELGAVVTLRGRGSFAMENHGCPVPERVGSREELNVPRVVTLQRVAAVDAAWPFGPLCSITAKGEGSGEGPVTVRGVYVHDGGATTVEGDGGVGITMMAPRPGSTAA